MSVRRALWFVAAALLASGCRYFRPIDPTSGNTPDTSGAAAPFEMAPAAASPAASAPTPGRIGSLKDANIAAMLLASNNTDISYARLAPSRAAREDIKQFAQRMLADHMGVNALVNDLLTRLDLAPEDNLASLDMRDESAARRDIMRDLSGFAFDSAYIANEVSYHQRFLSSIDNVMYPAARHPELRSLLSTVRPAVAAHLAHAEQVWANVMARR